MFNLFVFMFQASIVQFDLSHNICCVYDETLPKMVVFKDILEFMERLPIQKALTDQYKVFKSHIAHFWKNVVYEEANNVINSKVSIDGEDKDIIITEQLVREVWEFPNDENSPTGFPERNREKAVSEIRAKVGLKDEENDLLVLNHMDNETLIRLSKYHKNWPEPKTKTEFFGFIKSDKYEDPDPVNHLKWRNDAEMKEKSATDELTKLEEFVETRNEWFTKEVKEKKKRGGKRTPKVQTEEGSSSQPQKKCKKESCDDKEKSSSDEEESDIDAETERWIKENYDPRDRVKQKKRKRSADDNDETYVPLENVEIVKSPSSGGRKKSTSRKRVTTPATRKLIFKLKTKPASEPQNKPPSPPPQQSEPLPDPIHISPQHQTLSPIHEQPQITSPHI
ncbi:hypothetical protein Hanom_Chr10g00930681 [Helianthus anomalus]